MSEKEYVYAIHKEGPFKYKTAGEAFQDLAEIDNCPHRYGYCGG